MICNLDRCLPLLIQWGSCSNSTTILPSRVWKKHCCNGRCKLLAEIAPKPRDGWASIGNCCIPSWRNTVWITKGGSLRSLQPIVFVSFHDKKASAFLTTLRIHLHRQPMFTGVFGQSVVGTEREIEKERTMMPAERKE